MADDRRTSEDGGGDVLTLHHQVGGVTVIAEGTTCQGNLKGDTGVQIDGVLDGEVECGSVVIGSTGIVKGKVIGDTVYVAGTVEGEIVTKALKVKRTAQIDGDLAVSGSMSVSDGARVDGTIRMSQTKPQLKAISGEKGDANA